MQAASISGRMFASTPDSASLISILTLYFVISALVGTYPFAGSTSIRPAASRSFKERPPLVKSDGIPIMEPSLISDTDLILFLLLYSLIGAIKVWQIGVNL